jgi:hypothetical protein
MPPLSLLHEARSALCIAHWASMRDVLVTLSTDNHHLALSGDHHAGPLWLVTAWVRFADVLQSVDMVTLDGSFSTILAFASQEAFYEL